MWNYFFSGPNYLGRGPRITFGPHGPSSHTQTVTGPISAWGWGSFGANGIDASLYSGKKCYFFKGTEYIRVTRGIDDFGSVDPGYPAPISDWGWEAFGSHGIDAALWSGSVCYFFKGMQYIRVRRGEEDLGSMDAGYPKDIGLSWLLSGFGSGGVKGSTGVDAALYAGPKSIFFSGSKYLGVSRADEGRGLPDGGGISPASIADWDLHAITTADIDAALYSAGPLAPPPSGGARSNFNYFLEHGGDVLTGVTVTLAFDETFISTANGWSVQLNCYSENTPATIPEWQQYVLYSVPDSTGQTRDVYARIENWTTVNLDTGELYNADVHLCTMEFSAIKAGSSMTFTLHTDTSNNVTGCTYSITFEGGSGQTFFPAS
jgi:hypothetical protein